VNEQPRDRYGRPLRTSFEDAYPGVPLRTEIGIIEAWTLASAYLEEDLPFHAHEVFEQRWKCCSGNERQVWRALAQWAAALTHLARGNLVGSKTLAERAKDNLESCMNVPTEIDAVVVFESLGKLIGPAKNLSSNQVVES
jgi:uncharacterized protein